MTAQLKGQTDTNVNKHRISVKFGLIATTNASTIPTMSTVGHRRHNPLIVIIFGDMGYSLLQHCSSSSRSLIFSSILKIEDTSEIEEFSIAGTEC